MKGTNHIGKRFGSLTVVSFVGRDKHRKNNWRCRCDCGGETIAVSGNLTSGKHVRCRQCGEPRRLAKVTTHGYHKTRVYHIWNGMLQRCDNPNIDGYQNYGGKGIRVCDAWRDAGAFIAWALANGYTDGLTIDRRDPNADYTPENCEWVTKSENSKRMWRLREIV